MTTSIVHLNQAKDLKKAIEAEEQAIYFITNEEHFLQSEKKKSRAVPSASPNADLPSALFNILPENLHSYFRLLRNAGNPTKTKASYVSTKPLTGLSILGLGLVPNKISRYSSESRASFVEDLVSEKMGGISEGGTLIVQLTENEHQTSVLNAISRALPLFDRKSNSKKSSTLRIAFIDIEGQVLETESFAEQVGKATREAAMLVDTPPSELNPDGFAKAVHQFLSGLKGIRFEEIKGEALLRQGMQGIHGVGKAANTPPRLLMVHYAGKNPKLPHIALVGKGITFDTGGLNLKPTGSIETMKCDMGGAAAVLGAFRVLVHSGYSNPLSLLVCIAENANDANSYKPDDILTLHSKKTVEINNTDAEGRLLLADGVSYAARNLKAALIINAATLTGAQAIATGQQHAALVSNDAELEAHMIKASYQSGDLLHPLPFAPEFYQSEFDSKIADMKNSVKNRANAQSSCAAQFVWSHIEGIYGEGTDILWAHIDLASPAFRKERGTGFGVALIAEALRTLPEGLVKSVPQTPKNKVQVSRKKSPVRRR